MAGVARLGKDKAKGKLSGKNFRVYVNNKKVAYKGCKVKPHYPCGQPSGAAHCAAKITKGSSTVYVGTKHISRKGDSASCGHNISGGSGSVFAG